jgi:mannose-6-phosphate isomerase-like protein (cupin superfamily)
VKQSFTEKNHQGAAVTQRFDPSRYHINLEPLVGGLNKVDIDRFAAEQQPWFNQTICRVNDCVVRLGILEGDFHWHQHTDEDEFFYVISGHLVIDIENAQAIDLRPGSGAMMPRTVVHRPRALERTVVLMFEGAGVVPTGS